MSLVAVPDDGEMSLCGIRTPGRQLHAASGVPVAWVAEWAFGSAGPCWAHLGEKSVKSGLQPFLMSRREGGPAGPCDIGEQVSEPEDTTAIDRMDAAAVLEGWWWAPSEDELAEDEELRAMLRRSARGFPAWRQPSRRDWTRS